ncbi:MAG: hypothetical protein WD844_13495 [Thermoleophilaceae bacterium]
MSVQREIQAGPLLSGAGAVLLLVALFLNWYDEFSAWTIFEVIDLVLAGLALAAIAAALSGFGFPRWVPARALPVVGAAAFIVVASQLLNHPPAGTDRDIELGAWLAFVGSIAMLVGGLVSVARVSFAVNVSDRPGPGAAQDVAPPPPAPAREEPPPPAPPPAAGATPPHGDPAPPPAPPGPDDQTQRLPGE